MPASVRVRLVLLSAAVSAALLVAGCGDDDGGGSAGDPATLAPAGAPVFVEATVRPDPELGANVDALARAIAGVDDVGGLIIEELEADAAAEGEPFDYAEDVEPWLGERGGLFLDRYDGEDFGQGGFALQTTDSGAAQDFIDEFADPDEGEVVAMIDDFLVFADSRAAFEAMEAAADGDSLADDETFTEAFAETSEESVADVYVDVAAMVRQSGGEIDPETRLFLETSGIELEESTAVASLIPRQERIEIEISTDLTDAGPTSGDASQLLESLPAGSFAAIASDEFGERFREAIDRIDEEGIPGEVPPNQLKSTLKEAGIDLDSIASSVGDIALFAEGNSERSLGGAVVLSAEDASQAENTVASVGLFLRAAEVARVTAIKSGFSGFSIRDAELGAKPLVVGAKGERIAIAYGREAALAALSGKAGTLADDPAYEEAVEALGGTAISGFVKGPQALTLASALTSPDDEGFRAAKPYLTKVDYLALGGGESGDRSTAKLIVGIGK